MDAPPSTSWVNEGHEPLGQACFWPLAAPTKPVFLVRTMRNHLGPMPNF